jgi:hypothetical protein
LNKPLAIILATVALDAVGIGCAALPLMLGVKRGTPNTNVDRKLAEEAGKL